MEKEVRQICTELNDGKIAASQATEQLLDLFNVSQNTDNAYKKCAECGKMKMVGVQCKDPRTGQCDKDPRYIKDFIAPVVRQQSELLKAFLKWRLDKPHSDFQTQDYDIKEFLKAFNCA